jgi:hypothetical protein
VTGGKPIVIWSQFTSGVRSVNQSPLTTSLEKRKNANLFFYPGHHSRFFLLPSRLFLIVSIVSNCVFVWVKANAKTAHEELDGLAVSALRRTITEVKQYWSVIGWVLIRASEGTLSCWSRLHLQSIAPTNPHWAGVVDYGPFSLCAIHKEGSSSGDINRLMIVRLPPIGKPSPSDRSSSQMRTNANFSVLDTTRGNTNYVFVWVEGRNDALIEPSKLQVTAHDCSLAGQVNSAGH